MENVSLGLSQYLMVDILIINPRVSKKRSGYNTYKYMLTRISGIGIDKAKRVLKSTTQDNVISSLYPLIGQYIKYFLPQRLHRLNSRFYTDTLFAKDKSIVGNTCAKILTYR